MRKTSKITTVVNVDPQIVTAKQAMRTMSDEDLVFVAAYYPMVLNSMCMMITLEDQLEKLKLRF